MKVVCIDDYCLKGYRYKVKLTYGKSYDVLDIVPLSNTREYKIMNDLGLTAWYSNDVVMPLEEWRLEQLKELGV
jgi:hypothetical protein